MLPRTVKGKNFKRQKERRARVRRPQPSSRATYADLLTIGALFIANEAWARGRGRRLVAALCRTARRGAFWHGPGALGCLNEAVDPYR
jgi:hypothetical protein